MSAKRKSDDVMDELDRLVDRELSVLLGRHRSGRPKKDLTDPEPHTDVPQDEDMPDNVVRAHPLARRTARKAKEVSSEGLFTQEEEAFLANAVDWLTLRENPDILLSELSRRLEPADAEGEAWTEAPAEHPDEDDDWDGAFDPDDDQSETEDGDWGDDDAAALDPDPDDAPDRV